ncbi:hypothetical protein Bbelb_347680 [Branchiostoma belcheri]|nr:hypothetical protein Bbelb_347680 [Branchiostoma belcheri]
MPCLYMTGEGHARVSRAKKGVRELSGKVTALMTTVTEDLTFYLLPKSVADRVSVGYLGVLEVKMSGRRDYRNLEFEELDSSPEPDEKEQHRLGQENGDDDSLLGSARKRPDAGFRVRKSRLASFSVGGFTLGSRESLADNPPSARSDHDEAQDERRNILTPVQEAVQDSEEEDCRQGDLVDQSGIERTGEQWKLLEAARRDLKDYDEFSKKYDSYEKRQRLNTAASTRGEENTKQDDLSGMVLVYACYYCGETFDVQGERRRHMAVRHPLGDRKDSTLQWRGRDSLQQSNNAG